MNWSRFLSIAVVAIGWGVLLVAIGFFPLRVIALLVAIEVLL